MSARARLALDVGLFAALLVANNPAWTGLSTHEWLSLAIITPLLVHLIINWEWAVRIASRFAQRLRKVSRVNFVLDVALFVSAAAVMTSGIVVSRTIAGALGLLSTPNAIWYALHSLSANATIALLVVHLGLHWRWIARMLGLLQTRGAAWRSSAPARTVSGRRVAFREAGTRKLAVQPVRMRSGYSARQR